MEELFDKADNLLFNEGKFDDAKKVYEKIIA